MYEDALTEAKQVLVGTGYRADCAHTLAFALVHMHAAHVELRNQGSPLIRRAVVTEPYGGGGTTPDPLATQRLRAIADQLDQI